MLADIQRAFLLRALRSNRCILFVGAGFSVEASNAIGARVPAGDHL